MKASDVKEIVNWLRSWKDGPRQPDWTFKAADAIEARFMPKVEVPEGAKHELENDACYAFRCGACKRYWTEAWGSMDDVSGLDPEPGMEVECQHCGTELRLACWDPDMEGMYDEDG